MADRFARGGFISRRPTDKPLEFPLESGSYLITARDITRYGKRFADVLRELNEPSGRLTELPNRQRPRPHL